MNRDFLRNLAVRGDALRVMRRAPDGAVDLTFTSPPYYNAKPEYAEYDSYDAYLAWLGRIFEEVRRLTHPGRFMVVNVSPVIQPRAKRSEASRRFAIPFDINRMIEAAGWVFIDDIVWVKPAGAGKNRNGGFAQHRRPLAYKPNIRTEYLLVYRTDVDWLIDKDIADVDPNVVRYSEVPEGYETDNVWELPTAWDKVHPAVFPPALAERVIRYWSYEGELVFDPFGGIGTTALEALRLEREFFTIERNAVYADRMRERLDSFLPRASLFFGEAHGLRTRIFSEEQLPTPLERGGEMPPA